MRLRIVDLDGSVSSQAGLLRRFRPAIHDLRDWGPRIRLSCGFRSFQRFQTALGESLGPEPTESAALTFYGSGDFHHVSLALLRRITSPFNLLVLDKHPDWMRGVPVLHCGTWLYHAAQLPQVHRIYHVGGDLDFDNAYRWLAPWPELLSGKIKVIPAIRRFDKGKWAQVPHTPLRAHPDSPATASRLSEILEEDRENLARWPLYVSLDKDVLIAADAIVNWDSGSLTTAEVEVVLETFLEASGGDIVGTDIVGDWSEVRVQGLFRKALHWTEHPALAVDPAAARQQNEQLNLRLFEFIERHTRAPVRELAP